MWFHSLLASWKSGHSRSPRSRPRPARRGPRLTLEYLEDRSLPSNYSAATVSDLIADINAANKAGGANTITLTAPTPSPYALTAVNNTTNGPTGLPVIAAKDNLTIVGNGDTIERSTAAPLFRLLEVASGGSLTLGSLTLQGGFVGYLSGAGAEGGAIYNQGALVLNGVTVQDNMAGSSRSRLQLSPPEMAAGGGIFSSGGSVTLEGGTILQNNGAFGSNWSDGGGNAYGGGVYASGGTVTVINATLDNNTAGAGFSEYSDGYACGGGLHAKFGATVTLTNATLDGNTATGGGGASGGGLYLSATAATMSSCIVQGNVAQATGSGYGGEGGGVYISALPGSVGLDAATVAQVTGNTASSGAAYDDIVGPYATTIPNAPSNLTATATKQNGGDQVQLQWNNNSTAQSAVVVQRSSDDGKTWTTIATINGGATDYTDTTAARKTSYLYRVGASDVWGNSPFSNLATVTTP